MFKHVSILTSKTDTVYESAAHFMTEHGSCGVQNLLVLDSDMVLNADNTVTRTLAYETAEARELHKLANDVAKEDRTYTVEFVSFAEE